MHELRSPAGAPRGPIAARAPPRSALPGGGAVHTPHLGSTRRRAPGATASLQAAEATLRGASDGPGRQAGRGCQAGRRMAVSSGGHLKAAAARAAACAAPGRARWGPPWPRAAAATTPRSWRRAGRRRCATLGRPEAGCRGHGELPRCSGGAPACVGAARAPGGTGRAHGEVSSSKWGRQICFHQLVAPRLDCHVQGRAVGALQRLLAPRRLARPVARAVRILSRVARDVGVGARVQQQLHAGPVLPGAW